MERAATPLDDDARKDAMTPTPEGLGDGVLDRARNGDDGAFAQLYRDLAPRLRRYAASLVGDDADDVTGEAWLQIARDIRSFDGDLDALRGWAARIVRNRAMDLLRYRRRRPISPVPIDDVFDRPGVDDTEHDALTAMSTDAAIALIAALPREQAEAVMLRAIVGLDSAAAGEVLGKSATAVRVAAHRGLKRLARQLATRKGNGMRTRDADRMT
jgi:RNA polymerase sigma-70 factor, ECF subfamily